MHHFDSKPQAPRSKRKINENIATMSCLLFLLMNMKFHILLSWWSSKMLKRMKVWDARKTLRGRFTRIQISLSMILNFYPDPREQRNYTKTVLTRTCPKLVCCQQIVKKSSWESAELCFCYLLDLSHSLRTSSPLQGDWVTRDQPDHLLSPSTSSTKKTNIVLKLDFRPST